jgi:hypothetical protein
MIKVSRDKAKLRDAYYVEFMVRLERPIDPNGKARVSWGYWDDSGAGSWNGENQPIVQAFEAAQKFASDKHFSAIWINDLDLDTVGLWMPSGPIDYLDDHS